VKWVFALVVLVILGAGLALAGVLVLRWRDNMTETLKIVPGEQVFAMPSGAVPRAGGELVIPKEERQTAAKRPNPVPVGSESVEQGRKLFAIYCTPCHGSEGKGNGPVAAKFIPPPDLTNAALQKARTDGYIEHVIGTGGAVMPAYGEALTAEERWHVVNFLRSLAKR